MDGGEKKEYRLLSGKPVLAHAIQHFMQDDIFASILVIVPPGHIRRARRYLESLIDVSRILFAEGGTTRQESVYRGLLALEKHEPEYVLIHDGARPWVDPDLIERVLSTTIRKGACIPVVGVSDAVKRVGEAGLIESHPDRNRIYLAQTPQGFLYSGILEAHRKAGCMGKTFIDDAEVYAEFSGPVYTVPGNVKNIKITYSGDLE